MVGVHSPGPVVDEEEVPSQRDDPLLARVPKDAQQLSVPHQKPGLEEARAPLGVPLSKQRLHPPVQKFGALLSGPPLLGGPHRVMDILAKIVLGPCASVPLLLELYSKGRCSWVNKKRQKERKKERNSLRASCSSSSVEPLEFDPDP